MARQKTLGIKEYQTANGPRFVAQVRLKGHAPKSKSFDTREEAQEWKRGMEVDVGRGLHISTEQVPADLTLVQLFTAYVEMYPTKNRGREISPEAKRRFLRLAKHPMLERLLVRELTIDVMRDYCDLRVNGANPVLPSAVAHDFQAVLGSVSSMALWKKWKGFAPLAGCWKALRSEGLVGPAHKRTRRPSGEEMDMLLPHLRTAKPKKKIKVWQDIPMADIVEFASLNAFREGEILRLRWSKLNVAKSLTTIDRKDSASPTGRRDCVVPLFPEALAILLRQPRKAGEDRIFPFCQKTVASRFTQACFDLGINTKEMEKNDRLHFHDMRHEAITTMSRVLSVTEGMAVSGHKTTDNYNRYVNMQTEELSSIASKMSGLRTKTATVVPLRKAA